MENTPAAPAGPASPDDAGPAAAEPSAPSPKGMVITILGHKVTTHTLAVAAGILLSVFGPLIAQKWPQAQPAIDAVAKSLPAAPQAGPASSAPELGPYERNIRAAWANEPDSSVLTKAEKLKRLTYLYRRGAFEAENKFADLAELSKSFHDEAAKLEMTGQLAMLRGVITSEWHARIPEKFSGPITEPLRAKVSAFMHETIAILERTPGAK